jgi:molybdate transport system substrate-binding protein
VIAGSDQAPGRALSILCAGAAKGLVAALQPAFRAATGLEVVGTFGAVGAMREKLLSGAPCDVIVLTAALIEALEREGRVLPDSGVPLGQVRTGIAVRAGDPVPAIDDAASLRAALAGASCIVFPDPQRATAGIHFIEVLKRLGIHDAVAPRLSAFPNGAAAMHALAQAKDRGLIGCTQITEINYTPGVVLAGPLPPGFDLSTVYTAAVAAGARAPGLARRFVLLLSGPASRDARARGGFES